MCFPMCWENTSKTSPSERSWLHPAPSVIIHLIIRSPPSSQRVTMKKTSLLVAVLLLLTARTIIAAEKPNIIFFLSDDQRADFMGCAGHPILKTPTMDRLAGEGVRFENMFVSTSICAASRAKHTIGHSRAPCNRAIGHLALSGQSGRLGNRANRAIGQSGKSGNRVIGETKLAYMKVRTTIHFARLLTWPDWQSHE